jgi:hypothetical protein
MGEPVRPFFSRTQLQALDLKQLGWAEPRQGQTLRARFVEGEYMKADEYDWFFDDPSDFILHVSCRICGRLKGSGDVTAIRSFITYHRYHSISSVCIPEQSKPWLLFRKPGKN